MYRRPTPASNATARTNIDTKQDKTLHDDTVYNWLPSDSGKEGEVDLGSPVQFVQVVCRRLSVVVTCNCIWLVVGVVVL